jgi:phosphoribosyl 1,2-cyclic phosphodiesterase
VDAGLSRRELFRRLNEVGQDPEGLTAILLTHEHSDHICGLLPIAKKLRIPIYLTATTAPAIDWKECSPILETFAAGSSFPIGDIDVDSFTIPHDAVDPVGFCFRSGGVKIGYATDLGYIPDSIKFHLRGCHMLLLESNHDLEMLKVGPYPWSVKQRVMGRKGHLSNAVVSDFIRDDLDGTTAMLVLGHLSEHNNHPELVRMSAAEALGPRLAQTGLMVAGARDPVEVFRC